MLKPLLIGGLVSLFTFGIHAVMTTVIVIVSGRTAKGTGHLRLAGRVSILLAVTMLALMITHVIEIGAWAVVYDLLGIRTEKSGAFEFAFENYTALGYGDAVPGEGFRLYGPITALNGLLLIGWSVAIIFEVLRMAEVQFERPLKQPQRKRSR